jgi:UDP-GlcNAc:undecaprenyl-phosphate GlcNAc-1-phosphate transferase
MILLGFILVTWFFKKEWMGKGLRVTLYMLIPFLIYISQRNMVPWMNERSAQIYNLSFGILIIFVILTLKFTRRKKGFKTTPMDFLIIFIALVVPNLPDKQIQSYNMGLLAAKIIILFFSAEVLLGELRGKVDKLVYATISVLVLLSFRGFIG